MYACCFEHNTSKNFYFLCVRAWVCLCVFLLRVSDKYVIHSREVRIGPCKMGFSYGKIIRMRSLSPDSL